MSKFKTGDRFVCSENGLRGQIFCIYHNSIYQYDEYVVIWDSFPNRHSSYEIAGVDSLWEPELAGSPVGQSQAVAKVNPFSGIKQWADAMDNSVRKVAKDVFGNDIEEIGQRFANEYMSNFPGAKALTSKSCEHVRKTYTGLFEQYDYCQKCDVKL